MSLLIFVWSNFLRSDFHFISNANPSKSNSCQNCFVLSLEAPTLVSRTAPPSSHGSICFETHVTQMSDGWILFGFIGVYFSLSIRMWDSIYIEWCPRERTVIECPCGETEINRVFARNLIIDVLAKFYLSFFALVWKLPFTSNWNILFCFREQLRPAKNVRTKLMGFSTELSWLAAILVELTGTTEVSSNTSPHSMPQMGPLDPLRVTKNCARKWKMSICQMTTEKTRSKQENTFKRNCTFTTRNSER